jgi:predicted NBD/HSP70 family sugar kinase
MRDTRQSPPTGSRELMHQLNAARLIHELRQGGPLSRADLSRAVGLSKPTVYALVDEVEKFGYITSTTDYQDMKGPGRPGRLYSFRPDYGYIIGADIGADKIIVMIADLDGSVLAKVRVNWREAARTTHGHLLKIFRDACDAAMEQAKVDPSRLMNVVVGIPGVLSDEGLIGHIPQIPEWEGFALQRELSSMFECPVVVEREVDSFVRAEKWVGCAKDLSNAILVQLGVGVGAGLLIDGEVFHGAHRAAGEIGSMPIGAVDTTQMGFGQFEWACGGAGIAVRGAQAALSKNGEAILAAVGGDVESIDAAIVFATARAGDPVAQRIVNEAVDTLGMGIATLVCALNPEAVILSGGIALSQDLIVGRLVSQLERIVPIPPRVVVSELTDSAVSLGAINHGLDLAAKWLTRVPELGTNLTKNT